ncbi:MAG: alpha/beta fold hydrolase [Mycobacterium sp.]
MSWPDRDTVEMVDAYRRTWQHHGVAQVARGGTTVSYDVHGDGPAIVCTHSFLFDRHMWRHQVPVLVDRGWRVVAIDMRGHGHSGPSREPFSVYDVMDDVLAILDAEGVEHAVWMGDSIGGFLSLRAGLRHPARVRALVIVDSDAGP